MFRFSGSTCTVLAALALAVIVPAAASAAEQEHQEPALLERIHILPVGDDYHLGKLRGKNTPPNKRTEACEARFDRWREHQDEFLSFSYPDDPRVSLEIKTPDDRIPVDGSPIASSENSFFRCYRLTFNGETYCLLLLDRQTDFDNGICFCGHVAYSKYLAHHGGLYRFSLLANGRVKKAQALGDGLRVVLFERTHLPMHESVYVQIALSLQFRQPPKDLEALKAQMQESYGKVGFLEKEMDREAVVALLGAPTEDDDKSLKYVFQRSYDEPPGCRKMEVTWNIPLEQGKFVGLPAHWMDDTWLPPEPGSVQWLEAKLDGQQGESDSVEPATEEELQPILERVVGLLPSVEYRHWWPLCNTAALLADRGAKDPRVLEVVKQRFLDPQLSAVEAIKVLKSYDDDVSQELLVKRIHVEMDFARRPQVLAEQEQPVIGWGGLEELFSQLDPDEGELASLIAAAIDHPHAEVRLSGYKSCALLSESAARSCLAKGLLDPSPEIRSRCVVVLWLNIEPPGSLELLRAHRAKEKNPAVLEELNYAIKSLEEQ